MANLTDPHDWIIWSADMEDIASIVRMLDLMPRLKWIKIDRAFLDNNEDGWNIFPILHERGLKIFDDAKAIEVDQKLETIAKAHARRAQPHILNCMAHAVTFCDEREFDALKRFTKVCADNGIASCGVSVMTSKKPQVVKAEFNGRTPDEQVEWYALQMVEAGFGTIVCSPWELAIFKQNPKLASLLPINPGIRPEGSDPGTQGRFATPAEAIQWGSSRLVVGGPITDAADPAAALDAIAAEVAVALSRKED